MQESPRLGDNSKAKKAVTKCRTEEDPIANELTELMR
jgi:hypothetical protein